MRSDLHDVQVYLHHETSPGIEDEGAIRVSLDGNDKKAVWLPKAACQFERQSRNLAIVTASERLLTEKGLV